MQQLCRQAEPITYEPSYTDTLGSEKILFYIWKTTSLGRRCLVLHLDFLDLVSVSLSEINFIQQFANVS